MILVIDNYDSFVYNLARYIKLAGGETVIVRNDAISLQQVNAYNPSHIVLSPGPCTPNEAGVTLEIIKQFYTRVPILGVCLGCQAIGQLFGATLTTAIEPLHGQSSQIKHNQRDIFLNIPTPLKVGRYHSLIVTNIDKAPELEVTATSSILEVMALQHRKYPVFGVQFHPESILTDYGMELIQNFLKY